MKIRKYKCAVLLCLAVLTVAGLSRPAAAASAYEVSLAVMVDTDTAKPVMPREDVPFRLCVDNQGGSSWIRIRAETSSTGIGDSFTDANIRVGRDWVKRGDYFYLTLAASAGTRYQAIESFRVPDVAASDGGTLTIGVWAEGIDVRSVSPDFTLDDPWKGRTPSNVVYYSNGGGGGSGGGSGSPYSVSVSTGLARFSAPQSRGISSTGSWYLEDAEHQLWKFGSKARGEYASDGWYYLYNGYTDAASKYQWFYFDKAGYMDVGWINSSGNDWYHMHDLSDGNLGALDTGFLHDRQDGKRYYLDETVGLMKTGWQTVSGRQYYFTQISEIPAANWIYKKLGDTAAGRWFYNAVGLRSYGSMYVNERTPDGHFVDAEGVMVE